MFSWHFELILTTAVTIIPLDKVTKVKIDIFDGAVVFVHKVFIIIIFPLKIWAHCVCFVGWHSTLDEVKNQKKIKIKSFHFIRTIWLTSMLTELTHTVQILFIFISLGSSIERCSRASRYYFDRFSAFCVSSLLYFYFTVYFLNAINNHISYLTWI